MRFHLLAVVLFAMGQLTVRVEAASCFAAPPGLVGWWSGDGNANDLISANTGVLSGGASATNAGLNGSAFSFDGTNGYVQVPDSTLLRPSNFTVEAWVNFDALNSSVSGGDTAGWQYIVFKKNTRASNFEGYSLEKQRVGGMDVFGFEVSSATGFVTKVVATTAISTGTWYHVAAVRDTNFVRIYVNGTLQAQTHANYPQDYAIGSPLYFGTSGQAYDGKLKGRLDEVSLFNRALSAGEIASIYAAGSAGKCKPPPNDLFSNATTIVGQTNTVNGSNAGATKEPGEPNHNNNNTVASVWWNWTAPTNWPVFVDTIGSSFVTELAVYSGNAVSNLTFVASDSFSGGSGTSLLRFLPVKGTVYRAAVDGQSGATGSIVLRVRQIPQALPAAPANNQFANPVVLSGSTFATNGLLSGANLEAGEVPFAGDTASVWYRWTAPASGRVAVESERHIVVGTGASVSTLTPLAASYLGCQYQTAEFDATAGTIYRIAVCGSEYDTNRFSLLLHYPPVNDDFANALTLTGNAAQFDDSNEGATRQAGDPSFPDKPWYSGCATVWWTFAPVSDGTVTMAASGLSSSDSFWLAAFQGQTLPSLMRISDNIERPGFSTHSNYMRFDVVAGQSYAVSLDQFTPGIYTLNFSFIQAPSNNYFANRTPMAPDALTVYGSNVGANTENNEPTHAIPAAGRSVWWSWTPAQSGALFLTTFGSTFDTVLDVYQGTNLAGLSLVASNNDAYVFGNTGQTNDPSSRVRFNAQAGTNYQIAVSGAKSDCGSVSLNFVTLGIENIVAINRNVQVDGSILFTNTLLLTNLRTNGSGQLRLRLFARAGYSFLDGAGASDGIFLDPTNTLDLALGTINVPSTIGAGNSLQAVVSGICPAPVEGPGQHWGVGRGVIAYLEEQVAGAWELRDARLILVGEWPVVAGYGGPGGGVITITAGAGSANLAYLEINLGPAAAIAQGGGWRVAGSPYYPDYYTLNNLVAFAASGTHPIEFQPVPGWSLTSPTNISVPLGQKVIVTAAYVTPVLSLAGGDIAAFGFTGGPFNPNSTIYTISNSGSASMNWTVTNSATWLALSGRAGTLAAKGSTNVTVTLTNVNALAAGSYTNRLGFTNTLSGFGNTSRNVTLNVHVPIRLINPAAFSDGRVAMTLQGLTNRPYAILGTTNLLEPASNWTLVKQVTNGPGGQISFTNPPVFTNVAPASAPRFYRAKEL